MEELIILIQIGIFIAILIAVVILAFRRLTKIDQEKFEKRDF